MPRKKTLLPASPEFTAPTESAVVEPQIPLLDAISTQLLAASEQGIEALTALKAQLNNAARHPRYS